MLRALTPCKLSFDRLNFFVFLPLTAAPKTGMVIWTSTL